MLVPRGLRHFNDVVSTQYSVLHHLYRTFRITANLQHDDKNGLQSQSYKQYNTIESTQVTLGKDCNNST